MPSSAELQIIINGQDKTSQVLKNIKSEVGGLEGAFRNVGTVAAGFLAAGAVQQGLGAVTGFLGDSVSAASDLGESINAVTQIFGDNAQEVLDWGRQNATSFGLSSRAFNQMATPLGAMLKNAGLSMDDVTSSTIDLTKRAADMASVFNTDVDEALAAIQAGLRGESDPLEKFGVGLSAAKVEARALADTGKTLKSELTEQEKALARINIIMEQTNDVSGDFQNTSDGLANSQRIAAARMEELQATIGEKLMPVTVKITELKLKLIDAIVTHVIPTLEELYRKHWPAVQKAIQDVVQLVEEWWPRLQPIFAFIFDFYKTQVEGFIQQTEGIIKIITGVVDFVDAIVHGEWADAWAALGDIAGGVMDLLEGTVKRVFGNIPQLIQGVVGDVLSAARNVGAAILAGILEGMKALPGLAGQLVAQIEAALKSIINVGIDRINEAIPNDISFKIAGVGKTFDLPDNPIPRLARGHPFIPFDDFPALLHRGERVLTAAENRSFNDMRSWSREQVVNIVLNAPVYGMSDFQEQVREAVRSAMRQGLIRMEPAHG